METTEEKFPYELNWAKTQQQTCCAISKDVAIKLKELYDLGAKNKEHRVSAERAQRILLETVLLDKWEEKLTVTIAKIKSFFSADHAKQRRAIELEVLEAQDVERATDEIIAAEEAKHALDLLDVEES